MATTTKAEFIVITGIALTNIPIPRNSKIPVTFALEMAYSSFLFHCLWKSIYKKAELRNGSRS